MHILKNSLKRVFFLTLCASFLFASAYGRMKIIVVSHGQATDPFWGIVKNSVEQAEKDFSRSEKLKVFYRAPATFDMVEMARLIDQAIAEKPDGLVISLPDANALGPAVRKAVRAGIPVVSMNSGSGDYDKLGILAHVGQDEYFAGLGAGKKMKAMGAKKVLIVNHEVGNVALDKRAEGFIEGFGAGEVLAVSTDPSEIKAAVTARLKRDRGIDGILTLGAGASGDHVYDALRQLGSLKKIKLASFDLSAKMLNATGRNQVAFLIDQQPYLQGYLPVAALVQLKRYGVNPTGIVNTGPGFVTPQNAKAVMRWQKSGYR